jgi:hypothetical protein
MKSLEDLCSLAVTMGLMSEPEAKEKRLRIDVWGNPYEWEVEKGTERTCVRIWSRGANGRSKYGESYYLELTFLGAGEPRIISDPPLEYKGSLRDFK